MRPKTATAAGGGWGWFGACEDWNCHLFPLPGKSEGKIPIPSKNCQRWDGLKVLAHPYPTLLKNYFKSANCCALEKYRALGS